MLSSLCCVVELCKAVTNVCPDKNKESSSPGGIECSTNDISLSNHIVSEEPRVEEGSLRGSTLEQSIVEAKDVISTIRGITEVNMGLVGKRVVVLESEATSDMDNDVVGTVLSWSEATGTYRVAIDTSKSAVAHVKPSNLAIQDVNHVKERVQKLQSQIASVETENRVLGTWSSSIHRPCGHRMEPMLVDNPPYLARLSASYDGGRSAESPGSSTRRERASEMRL